MPRLQFAAAAAGGLVLALTAALVAPAPAQAAVINGLQTINAKIDAQAVPFKLEETGGGLCDSAGSGTSNPLITIDRDAPRAGGNFPHQIVAQSEGVADDEIELFCSSDDDDFTFDRILVAGWKRPAGSITVIFTPGN